MPSQPEVRVLATLIIAACYIKEVPAVSVAAMGKLETAVNGLGTFNGPNATSKVM
jgi:hypothetical protein